MAEYISRERLIEKLGDSEIAENDRIDIGYNAALNDVKQYLTEMPAADVQPVNQWISINDRLPKPEKEVLVWYRYTWGAGFTAYRLGISKWYDSRKRWCESYLPKDIEVLYWQPLPVPPNE